MRISIKINETKKNEEPKLQNGIEKKRVSLRR